VLDRDCMLFDLNSWSFQQPCYVSSLYMCVSLSIQQEKHRHLAVWDLCSFDVLVRGRPQKPLNRNNNTNTNKNNSQQDETPDEYVYDIGHRSSHESSATRLPKNRISCLTVNRSSSHIDIRTMNQTGCSYRRGSIGILCT
jgi:hypothetical protein